MQREAALDWTTWQSRELVEGRADTLSHDRRTRGIIPRSRRFIGRNVPTVEIAVFSHHDSTSESSRPAHRLVALATEALAHATAEDCACFRDKSHGGEFDGAQGIDEIYRQKARLETIAAVYLEPERRATRARVSFPNTSEHWLALAGRRRRGTTDNRGGADYDYRTHQSVSQ